MAKSEHSCRAPCLARVVEVKIQTDRPNIRACLRSTLLPLGSDILNAVHPFPRVKTDIFLSEK